MSKLANALEGNQAKDGWAGVPYVRIDGETDSRDRRTACLRFKEDPAIRVALLSITAAGAPLLSELVLSVLLHLLPIVQTGFPYSPLLRISYGTLCKCCAFANIDAAAHVCGQHKLGMNM